MKIVVIDGQGGGMGKSIIENIRKKYIDVEIIAVGTNSLATSAMLKAGASAGATGENAVIFNCREADIIAGPVGICFANSMHGEISPSLASAVSSSKAQKLLIPMSKCHATIIGISEKPFGAYIEEMMEKLSTFLH